MKLFTKMNRVLKKGGNFILSGILGEGKKQMESFLLSEKNILIKEIMQEKGWICLVLNKTREE